MCNMLPPHSTILIRTCCVCKRHFGVKPAHGGEGGESHGYCPECFKVALTALRDKRGGGLKLSDQPEQQVNDKR